MNREIKFRGWFGGSKYSNPQMLYDEVPGDCLRWKAIAHIMQYTGLKDKNGKEIYEGDIVKGRYWVSGTEKRIIGKIVYVTCGFYADGIGKYSGLRKEPNGLYEVIGNIHENPELIPE